MSLPDGCRIKPRDKQSQPLTDETFGIFKTAIQGSSFLNSSHGFNHFDSYQMCFASTPSFDLKKKRGGAKVKENQDNVQD